MSTKKKSRAQRRRREHGQAKPGRLNPATLFMIGIGLCILIIGLIAVVVSDGTPPPPRPGAVWSEAHQHWH